MTRDYVLDQGFAQERARLSGMESRALLDELGIGRGWKCLEVGAGGGSLVEWMADRGAHVTAIDIDTRFIESLASNSIEVRRPGGWIVIETSTGAPSVSRATTRPTRWSTQS